MYDLRIKYQYIECIVLKNDGRGINAMLKKSLNTTLACNTRISFYNINQCS